MSTAQRTRRRAAARAPRNFLIKFTAPCGHRAIVCLKFACGYLLLCLKFAVQCGHSAVLKKILQCSAVAGRNLAVQCGHSAGKVQDARDNSTENCLFLESVSDFFNFVPKSSVLKKKLRH